MKDRDVIGLMINNDPLIWNRNFRELQEKGLIEYLGGNGAFGGPGTGSAPFLYKWHIPKSGENRFGYEWQEKSFESTDGDIDGNRKGYCYFAMVMRVEIPDIEEYERIKEELLSTMYLL